MAWSKLNQTEKANVLTHAIGIFIFGILGYFFLFNNYNAIPQILYISMVVFFSTAILVYLSSTIYHLTLNPEKKIIWRNIDHIAIFFLIGGTYQPFVMMYYAGERGIIFMIVMWSLIFLGTLYKLFVKNSWGWISTLFYLGLGWMVLFIINPIWKAISTSSLIWLLVGGLAYTLGVYFYKSKTISFHHAIWHLFVLLGTLCHYVSIVLGINSI
jgi:hemolysin III